MYSVGIIVVSDRAFRGERPDECIPVFESALTGGRFQICAETIVNDDREKIRKTLEDFVAREFQLVFTTGGTGCSNRDNTPEVTREIVTKLTPGIDEAIRSFSHKKSMFAMYSRGCSGIARRTLVINLPGSPQAVKEIVEFLLPSLHHPLNLIIGSCVDCSEDIGK